MVDGSQQPYNRKAWMKQKAAAKEVWYSFRDTEGQVPHDPPGHIFEVTSVSLNREAGISLCGHLVFFVVFETSKLGLEPVQRHALRPGVKRAEVWLFLTELDIYRNSRVFALLVKPQNSWRKVAIS